MNLKKSFLALLCACVLPLAACAAPVPEESTAPEESAVPENTTWPGYYRPEDLSAYPTVPYEDLAVCSDFYYKCAYDGIYDLQGAVERMDGATVQTDGSRHTGWIILTDWQSYQTFLDTVQQVTSEIPSESSSYGRLVPYCQSLLDAEFFREYDLLVVDLYYPASLGGVQSRISSLTFDTLDGTRDLARLTIQEDAETLGNISATGDCPGEMYLIPVEKARQVGEAALTFQRVNWKDPVRVVE